MTDNIIDFSKYLRPEEPKDFEVSLNGKTLWVTKVFHPKAKSYDLCVQLDERDNHFTKVGIIKDVDAFKRFFEDVERS